VTRVCLDSNVVVAAFAARGLCADLLRLVLSEHDLIVPEVVADEVRRILRSKLKVSPEALATWEAVIARCEIVPRGSAQSPVPIGDPDDERVLADAIAGKSEILVSGDGDLLAVARESPVPILSPRAFMILTRGEPG
jgi:putative PIN family toxin of toxin-antitoxin system